MKRAWYYISNLGISKENTSRNLRTHILGNQLNAIVFISTIVLLIVLRVENYFNHTSMGIGSLRVALLSLLTLINLLAASFRFHSFSKISLIIFVPVIFVLFPTLIGFVEDESFVYYPYVIIALSILPQLLLYHDINRFLFFTSTLYYLLLIIFIDRLLIWFMPYNLPILDHIKSFYTYYKASHIIIFLFINLAVFYLIKQNRNFEKDLDDQNRALKKTINKLQKTQQQLIQSEKMAAMGTLVSGIAHEINNPLNYIQGGITLMRELKDNKKLSVKSEAAEEMDMIESMMKSGVDKIKHIVKSLITFAGQEENKIVECDINQLICDTLLFLNSDIPPEVKCEKEFHLDRLVPVYPDQIHQVLLNVFNNAIYEIKKSTKSYLTRLNIKTGIHHSEENQEYAMIQIENTGSPIAPHLLKKVFDPFFTTKGPNEGTGLGLSVSFEIIKKHGGSIEMKNTRDGVKCIILLSL